MYANGEDLVFRATIPGFLNCTQEGNLPGCLFKFDRPNEQCTEGRTGNNEEDISFLMTVVRPKFEKYSIACTLSLLYYTLAVCTEFMV